MSDQDALSALLGERAERQHREMLMTTIAAAVIGTGAAASKPVSISLEEYLDKICTGAWVIADQAMKVRDELIKQGRIQT